MTARWTNVRAAASALLLAAAATPAQAQRAHGPENFSVAQRPCGAYYGSEYSYECVETRFEGLKRHVCAYRTGPPCSPGGVPPR